jgi:hypothetical protein
MHCATLNGLARATVAKKLACFYSTPPQVPALGGRRSDSAVELQGVACVDLSPVSDLTLWPHEVVVGGAGNFRRGEKLTCLWCLLRSRKMFQLLSLFPSEEAIKRGDKDYHAAVNIANEMHARVAHWSQGGW